MDGDRFNELTKAIASGASRRSVVKSIAAGIIGSVLGVARVGATGAQERVRGPGRVCRENSDCVAGAECRSDGLRKRCACAGDTQPCGRACIPFDACCTDSDCGGLTCCNGTCCDLLCKDGVCMDHCVDQACFGSCVEKFCFGFNYSFNFTFNQSTSCTRHCASQCLDPSCDLTGTF